MAQMLCRSDLRSTCFLFHAPIITLSREQCMQREQQQALEQLRLKQQQQQQQEVEEQGRYQLAREAAPAIDIPGEQVKEIPTDVLKVKYRE